MLSNSSNWLNRAVTHLTFQKPAVSSWRKTNPHNVPLWHHDYLPAGRAKHANLFATQNHHCASPPKTQWGSNKVAVQDESGEHGRCNHLMDISEVAVYLNMKASTLYSYVERKQIPHVRIGKLIRFNRRQIDSWLASLSVQVPETGRNKDEYLGFTKSTREIDNIVERAIAGSSGSRYTTKRGKQPASGREV